MKRKQKETGGVAAVCQLRTGNTHPFGVMKGFTPLGAGEERIYREMREAIPVLDAAVADGANSLNGLTFGVSNEDALMDEARRAAVAEAKARAELLASAAGVTLGPIISISEAAEMMPRPMPMMRAAAEAMPAPVPVEGGELGLSASVSIVWALEQ